MNKITLHTDGMVSVSDRSSMTYACTEEDSMDFLEWFTGVRSKSVFENDVVFNDNGVMVRLVKE